MKFIAPIKLTLLLLWLTHLNANAENKEKEPWQNHQVFAVNKEAPHASLFPFESSNAALLNNKEQSNNYLLLNGLWKFDWQRSPQDKPAGFQHNSFDDENWSVIPVPGNWETKGFGFPIYLDERFPFVTKWPDAPQEYNPIGSYRKPFVLPKAWQNKQIFLHIGAAKSSLDVWLNGKKVGFSQGAKTPAEFDITQFVQQNDNLLALQIRRWSDASYLESQDMLRISGIERDVYLYATEKQHIFDVHAKPTLNKNFTQGKLTVDVTMKNYQQTSAIKNMIEIKLLDQKNGMRVLLHKQQKVNLPADGA